MMEKKEQSKLILFISVLILITLVIIVNFLRNKDNQDIWNYKNIKGYKLVVEGEETTDRIIYWTLNDIIRSYILSYDKFANMSDLSYELENQTSYKDYYKALSKEYRKFLSYNEYLKVSKNFFEKFEVNTKQEMPTLDIDNIIRNIYYYNENTYMCELYCEPNDKTAYIVIRLEEKNNNFWITYIE